MENQENISLIDEISLNDYGELLQYQYFKNNF